MPLYAPEAPCGTHDCRLDYLDANTIRLSRYGGSKLMINGRLEEIPASGVNLGMYGGWADLDNIIVVAWMVGGAMALTYYNDTIINDANGMAVVQSRPDLTVVGMVLGRSATFVKNNAACGVISYWNRKLYCFGRSDSGGTNSGTDVILSAFSREFVAFKGDSVKLALSGYTYLDVAGNTSAMSIGVNRPEGETGIGQGNNAFGTNVNWPFCIGAHADYVTNNDGRHGLRVHVLVNGGTGNWQGWAGVALEA